VVGVDNSDAQLALARSHGGPGSRVRYLRDDACRPRSC
jgi:hypothetical protein